MNLSSADRLPIFILNFYIREPSEFSIAEGLGERLVEDFGLFYKISD